MELMERYYRGDHPLAHVPPEMNARYLVQFQEILRQSRANFMGLVIDSTSERLRVNGFRLSAADDKSADDGARMIWQANQMDAQAPLAVTEALTKRRSYLSVWAGDEYPTIAVEDPCQTIVENEPGNPRKRAAGLKVWVDDWTGEDRANVYLPDGIYKFRRVREEERPPNRVVPAVRPDRSSPKVQEWEELTDEFLANPHGVVPIIPLVNRPDLLGYGQSEIDTVIPIQDRINGTIFNRVLAGWFAAFRQKWATGIDIPEDADGNPVEPFDAAINRMFISESDQAKFGTFDATDLSPYLKAHERDLQDIATITRTPRHYLFQEGQSPSGDAIKSAETGLVAKVRQKQSYMAEPFEEAIRLARLFAGEGEAPVDSEIIWSDPEYRSEAEQTDAIIKQHAAGLITTQMAQEKLGYTATEIIRMSEELAAQALAEQAAALTAQVMSGPRSSVRNVERDGLGQVTRVVEQPQ
jgi:hypothetical protein